MFLFEMGLLLCDHSRRINNPGTKKFPKHNTVLFTVTSTVLFNSACFQCLNQKYADVLE